MLSQLMDAVFGCRHSRYSFPITLRGAARRSQAASRTGTYVTCLDCGKELSYDWEQMKVLGAPAKGRARVLLTKEAA